MTPEDLAAFRTVSDPQLHPDGVRIAFVVSRLNLDKDRYDRRIWLWDGEQARPFTAGPGDGAPRWSPDGTRLAFLRRDEREDNVKSQVHVIPTDGGEPARLTEFDLGATEAEWSPDGTKLAVIGKTYTEEWAGLDGDERQRRPKRVDRRGWRWDDTGWWFDRRAHVYVVDPDGELEPRLVTPGDYNEESVAWDGGGQRIAFVSARHDRRGLDPGSGVYAVPAEGGEAERLLDLGAWHWVGYDPAGRLHAYGGPDPWAWPDVPVMYRLEDGGSLTGLTAKLERDVMPHAPLVEPAGPQWLADGSFLSAVEDDGRLAVYRVDAGGTSEMVLGGDRAVTGVAARPDGRAFAFTATTPTDPGELYWWEEGEERRLTSFNDEFRASVALAEPQTFSFECDGVDVHGWAYLPPGDEPVPLLLNIHGGPASQYGYGFFDEFQIYAAAGYGVVACNPRGSSGRGRDYVRAVVGRWAEAEPPDLRDLRACVDAALERFPRLDPGRIGVMGGSYGGFATTRLLALDDRFRSAIVERALTGFPSFFGTADIGPYFPQMYLDAKLPEAEEQYRMASPLAHAFRITTPTLVLHSENDWRCPIEQAEQLFTILQYQGVDTEMVRFPGEGHELSRSGKPRHRKERFEVVLDWHARHLVGTDPA